MFDLLQSFSTATPTHTLYSEKSVDNGATSSKKRKLQSRVEPMRRGRSGAGGLTQDRDAPVSKMWRFDGSETNEVGTVNSIEFNRPQESDLDEELDHSRLATIDASVTIADADAAEDEKERQSWWHTFKYRPILGMVPVNMLNRPLEVILVERPQFDLDLPPRFAGTHDEDRSQDQFLRSTT